eukprot:185810-Rhodomonas_salina.1
MGKVPGEEGDPATDYVPLAYMAMGVVATEERTTWCVCACLCVSVFVCVCVCAVRGGIKGVASTLCTRAAGECS